MLSIDVNVLNVSNGIYMDTKIVFYVTDQGTAALEIDTNRFATAISQDRSLPNIISSIGFIFNLGNMVVTFQLIKVERQQARIVKLSKENEKDNKEDGGDKDK